MLNVVFSCTIDTSYLDTFFGTKTAPQYVCEWFLETEEDFRRFDAIFHRRIAYSKAVHPKVKEWVAANIVRWQTEKPKWFKIGKIRNDFLPSAVLIAEGGARRRRSSLSLREIVGLDGEKNNNSSGTVEPAND